MQSRKFTLTPTQNAILRLLEEAGEEDLRTIKASLKVADSELAGEIAELVRIQFVKSTSANGWPVLLLTPRGRAALTA